MLVEHPTIGGIATRTVRWVGDADKPAFLFLHGFSDSADSWRRVQRRLAEAGHASLAVDQPSHGHADRLDADRPVVDQFVDFARAAATETAAGGPVIVCGNSLGGAHTLLLAERNPEVVRAAVVISPAAFDHPRWFEALGREELRTRFERRGPLRPNRARSALVGAAFRTVGFGRPWRAPTGFVEEWRGRMRDPNIREGIRELGLRLPDAYLDVELFDLAAVEAPVLALWGNRDRLALISSRSSLEAGLSDVEFVELKGIGHMPQLEAPGLTTKYLRRFAERV